MGLRPRIGVQRQPVVAARALAMLAVALVAAACVPAAHTAGPGAAGFSFAVIGDLGYVPEEEPRVDGVMADLDRDADLAFVVHVGDLSSPRYSCTDDLVIRRLAQFQASAHPLVFTPGDNDWTDCHEPAVKGANPLERLVRIRAVLFPGDRALGRRTLALTRQSADPAFASYRENVRWERGGVTFLTLHVTGSNNGRGRTPEGDAEWAQRNQANLAWLQQGFAHARAAGSRAVMILQQANIYPEFPPFPGSPKETAGFTDLRERFRQEALAFGKPVVLVHGDSHYFRIDKPLSPMRVRGQPVVTALENFTRVETFGSPYHHWLHVTVDASDPNVFTFRPRMVPANLGPRP